jgi:hypothetical protein
LEQKMGEMLDRAERVIKNAPDPRTAAMATLREMRTPSPEVLAAAAKLPPQATPDAIWEAMICAAVK